MDCGGRQSKFSSAARIHETLAGARNRDRRGRLSGKGRRQPRQRPRSHVPRRQETVHRHQSRREGARQIGQPAGIPVHSRRKAMKRMSAGVISAICALSCTLPVSGQTGAKNGEWRTYGGDLGNTHYSPLDQIAAGNFSKLQVAWRFKTDNLGPRPEFNFEGTPLMANGVIYSTAGTRRAVVALDGATGELLWVHGEHEGARGTAAPRQLSGRGLAYWTDGREERILYVTPGYRLVALDAKTGNLVPGFGQAGMVDLKLQDDQEIDLVTGEVGLHATPVVANDVVIVGAAHRPGGVVKSKTNVKGFVRGFHARPETRVWIFHTIPRSDEFGYDTWEKDSASYTGNTGVWGQISVDPDLGMAFIPVELPTGDYYGGRRPV